MASRFAVDALFWSVASQQEGLIPKSGRSCLRGFPPSTRISPRIKTIYISSCQCPWAIALMKVWIWSLGSAQQAPTAPSKRMGRIQGTNFTVQRYADVTNTVSSSYFWFVKRSNKSNVGPLFGKKYEISDTQVADAREKGKLNLWRSALKGLFRLNSRCTNSRVIIIRALDFACMYTFKVGISNQNEVDWGIFNNVNIQ